MRGKREREKEREVLSIEADWGDGRGNWGDWWQEMNSGKGMGAETVYV